MTDPAQGTLVVRDDLLFFDRGWVHLSNREGHELEPQDAALLELVLRGFGDLDVLFEVLEQHFSAQAQAIRTSLLESLKDGRSLLDLRPELELPRADVVVCDFSPGAAVLQGADLVARLRREGQRVVHLGIEENVRGRSAQNLSPKFCEKKDIAHGFFAFVQWSRSILRKLRPRRVVLCGPQDVLFFGDLGTDLETVACLDSAWPLSTDAGDLLGEGWIPDDPFEALRGLFYSLASSGRSFLGEMKRDSSSDYAILEGFALRHASTVLYGHLRQRAALEKLRGAERETRLAAFGTPVRAEVQRGVRDSLGLIFDLEVGFDPVMPLLNRLVPDLVNGNAPFRRLLVALPDGWRALSFEEGVLKTLPLEGAGPAPETVAALAFPGLITDMSGVFRCMAAGVPMLHVPSSKPHVLSAAPEGAYLRPYGLEALYDRWRRLDEPGDPLLDEVLGWQRSCLQRHDALAQVSASLEPTVADVAGTGAAS